MLTQISIVIITKNEAENIGRCIKVIKHLSDDIIVVDSHSTDQTVAIANQNGAKVTVIDWLGYGSTKNYGNQLATNDWILSLDADEVPNEQLMAYLQNWKPTAIHETLCMHRYMMWDNRLLLFGISKETKTRLFNRNNTSWDDKLVHESLIYKKAPKSVLASGKLLHFSYKNIQHAKEVNHKYARLSAQQSKSAGKRTFAFAPEIQWIYTFLKNFIFRLGFLDAKAGYTFAKLNAYYKYMKYKLLL